MGVDENLAWYSINTKPVGNFSQEKAEALRLQMERNLYIMVFIVLSILGKKSTSAEVVKPIVLYYSSTLSQDFSKHR